MICRIISWKLFTHISGQLLESCLSSVGKIPQLDYPLSSAIPHDPVSRFSLRPPKFGGSPGVRVQLDFLESAAILLTSPYIVACAIEMLPEGQRGTTPGRLAFCWLFIEIFAAWDNSRLCFHKTRRRLPKPPQAVNLLLWETGHPPSTCLPTD